MSSGSILTYKKVITLSVVQTGPTGPTGPQGFQSIYGVQGNQGPQGNQGYIDSFGLFGLQSILGLQGFQGVQGFQNILGIQGSQGLRGLTGSLGYRGLFGPVSSTSNTGVQGPPGPQNFIGYQGLQGFPSSLDSFTGEQGFYGNQGNQGVQSNIGIQGHIGFQDGQGHIGLQNLQGITSNFGNQGIQGLEGIQSIIGLQSNRGNQGIQGLNGITGIIGIVGEWQGPQGLTGLINHAEGIQSTIGFTGPQGNQGFQTFDGIIGIEGFQGLNGNQSNRGLIGVNSSDIGYQGVQSIFGNQGNRGILALIGLNGLIGFQHVDGNQGNISNISIESIVGIQSVEGIDGLQGFTGILGYQGIKAIEGLIDNQGYQGYQGYQGLQGTQSIIGVQGINTDLEANFGNIGVQGIIGLTGLRGLLEIQGVQSIVGNQGNQGNKGLIGLLDMFGLQGLQSNCGIQSIKGIIGTIGIQGLQGIQGIQGNQRTDSLRGLFGIRGLQGGSSESNRGIQGVQGLQGNLGNLSLVPPMTGAFASTTGANTYSTGGLSYTAWASSVFNNNQQPWLTFDYLNSNAAGYDYWMSNSTYNVTTNGNYIGTTITTAGAINYTGEWIQIQLPSAQYIDNFSIKQGGDYILSNTRAHSPDLFTLLGSNNGTTWNLVYNTDTPVSWPSTNLFVINFELPSPSSAYSYYRLVVRHVKGGDAAAFYNVTLIGDIWLYQYQYSFVGALGNRGFIGISTTEGIQGIQGRQGFRGIQGLIGQSTLEGVQGYQGLIGIGSIGIQGETGIIGIQGVDGYQGIQGIQSLRGEISVFGITGVFGNVGVQGTLRGLQGLQSQIGPQGSTGVKNMTGFANFPTTYTGPNIYYEWGNVGQNIQYNQTGDYTIGYNTNLVGDLYLNNYNFTGTIKLNDTSRNWNSLAISPDGKYQLAAPYWYPSTTATGYVYRSSDYGNTWITQAVSASGVTPSFATGAGWGASSIRNGGDWQILGATYDYVSNNGDGCIYISYNYGVDWNVLLYGGSYTRWNAIEFSKDGNYILAIANTNPTIFIYNNTGTSLVTPPTPSTWRYLVDQKWTYTIVGAIAADRGAALSYNGQYMLSALNTGQIYNSSDFGNTWTARNSARAWVDVAMSYDGKYQTAIVNAGQIYTSSDFGVNFTARDSNRTWTRVRMSADGKFQYATTAPGLVYQSSNYGVTWQAPILNNVTGTAIGLSSNSQYLTLGSYGNFIYKYDQFNLINSGNTGSSIYVDSLSGAIGIYNYNPSGSFTTSNDIFANRLIVGLGAGQQTGNTILGSNSAISNTTGVFNATLGNNSLRLNTTGSNNVSVGYNSLSTNTIGFNNVAVGSQSLLNNVTGAFNSALGNNANVNSNFRNYTILGASGTITGNNQIQLGNSSTTTYSYGAVQNRSDIRDKSDIKPTDFGLNFIENLNPVDFKFNFREDYKYQTITYEEKQIIEEIEHITYVDEESEIMAFDPVLQQEVPKKIFVTKPITTIETITKLEYIPIISDEFDEINYNLQTKKRKRYHHGLLAQDIQNLNFGGFQDHSVKGGEDILTIGYEEFIAPLIKSIQEIKNICDECQADLDSLKSK